MTYGSALGRTASEFQDGFVRTCVGRVPGRHRHQRTQEQVPEGTGGGWLAVFSVLVTAIKGFKGAVCFLELGRECAPPSTRRTSLL